MEIFMQWMIGMISFVVYMVLVVYMADKMNRRTWLWFLIGFFAPPLPVALLLALGKAND